MIGIPIYEASLAIAIDMSPTILVAPATIGPGKSVIDLCFYGSSLLDRALALVARGRPLKKLFKPKLGCMMRLKAQLQTLTKGSMSMMEYIERKRSVADFLAANSHIVSDEDLIGHILTELDLSYGAFTTAFMMKTENLSIDDLVGFLLQEETRLEQEHVRLASVRQITTALTRSTSSSLSRNYDPQRRCPICQLCNKQGHKTIDCWQRVNQTDFLSLAQSPKSATSNLYGPTQPPVDCNGNHLSIFHAGSSYLPNLKLSSVFIVPDLTKNLLSVSKLTKNNNVYMEFWPKHCNVKIFLGQTIL
uniref:CCHC-type domain-containing protein n=1 Tax=Lactuca sativa TaxID=4236 RepID=A0A9R1WRH8_LACSA|nr:hypothetical protein LSAT_V11C900481040 [Lactuca sativa]